MAGEPVALPPAFALRSEHQPPGEYLAVAIDYMEEGIWNDPEYLESIQRYGQKLVLDEAGSQTVALKADIAVSDFQSPSDKP